MRKIKLGYTLVEVLVALTIVGVISAILIPNVSNNIQERQSAANLAKAIAQIETGNQNLIQYANAQSGDGSYSDTLVTIRVEDIWGKGYSLEKIVEGLSEQGLSLEDLDDKGKLALVLAAAIANAQPILSSDDVIIDAVKSFWGLDGQSINSSDILAVENYDGTPYSEVALSNIFSFSKISAGVSITGSKSQSIGDELDAETGYVIYIDTNGWTTKPNKVGKDIFSFKLLNNGKLTPNTDADSGDRAKKVIEAGFRIDY